MLEVKRPVPTRSMKKGLHEELGSSDRSVKPEKLSENIRVKHAHDGTGQLVEQNSSSTHTVKEQVAPEENRDIASSNADNEFCKGNVSCTSYSRTFYDTQMATANCVHPHAQLEHA